MEYAMRRPERRIWSWGTVAAALGGIAVAAGVGVLSLCGWLLIGLGWCGGDGGTPNAEPGSAQAAACDSGIVGALVTGAGFAGPLAVLVGLVMAISQRRAKPMVIGAGVGAALAIGPAVVFQLLFG